MTSGPIGEAGAVTDVLVGVSRRFADACRRAGQPVPDAVHVRALIDTGAGVSGFSPRVFDCLGLRPIHLTPILTPSTPADEPHICEAFETTLAIVQNGRAHALPGVTQTIKMLGWNLADGVEGLIGRDVLAHGSFMYYGRDGTFTLSVVG